MIKKLLFLFCFIGSVVYGAGDGEERKNEPEEIEPSYLNGRKTNADSDLVALRAAYQAARDLYLGNPEEGALENAVWARIELFRAQIKMLPMENDLLRHSYLIALIYDLINMIQNLRSPEREQEFLQNLCPETSISCNQNLETQSLIFLKNLTIIDEDFFHSYNDYANFNRDHFGTVIEQVSRMVWLAQEEGFADRMFYQINCENMIAALIIFEANGLDTEFFYILNAINYNNASVFAGAIGFEKGFVIQALFHLLNLETCADHPCANFNNFFVGINVHQMILFLEKNDEFLETFLDFAQKNLKFKDALRQFLKSIDPSSINHEAIADLLELLDQPDDDECSMDSLSLSDDDQEDDDDGAPGLQVSAFSIYSDEILGAFNDFHLLIETAFMPSGS